MASWKRLTGETLAAPLAVARWTNIWYKYWLLWLAGDKIGLEWLDLHIHDMLSPRVHWGHIAYSIARYKYHWYEVPPVLIVDTELLEITRSWRISYSGSYGSLGTQNTRNGYMYRMMKYGGAGAQWGHIAHWTVRSTWHWYKVAPRAHWGQRMSENG